MNTLIKYFTVIFASTLIFGCSKYSKEEIEKLSKECIDFYHEQVSWDQYVKYLGHWIKNENLVISLAVKDREWDSTYTERLCVVNPKKGTISLPGLFRQEKWEK